MMVNCGVFQSKGAPRATATGRSPGLQANTLLAFTHSALHNLKGRDEVPRLIMKSIPSGFEGVANPGPHGFSEILYAYTLAAAINGSAFVGLNANTAFYNLTLALAMFFGRPLPDRLQRSPSGIAADERFQLGDRLFGLALVAGR